MSRGSEPAAGDGECAAARGTAPRKSCCSGGAAVLLVASHLPVLEALHDCAGDGCAVLAGQAAVRRIWLVQDDAALACGIGRGEVGGGGGLRRAPGPGPAWQHSVGRAWAGQGRALWAGHGPGRLHTAGGSAPELHAGYPLLGRLSAPMPTTSARVHISSRIVRGFEAVSLADQAVDFPKTDQQVPRGAKLHSMTTAGAQHVIATSLPAPGLSPPSAEARFADAGFAAALRLGDADWSAPGLRDR